VCCSVLHQAAVCCQVLSFLQRDAECGGYVAVCCSVVQCVALLRCIVLQSVVGMLQCVTVHCTVLQYIALHYAALYCVAECGKYGAVYCIGLQCVAVCCAAA